MLDNLGDVKKTEFDFNDLRAVVVTVNGVSTKHFGYELLPTKEDDARAERKAQIMNILNQAGAEQANFACHSTVEMYANKIMEVTE